MRTLHATLLFAALAGLLGWASPASAQIAPGGAAPCTGTLSADQILGCLNAPKPPKTRGIHRTRGIGVEGQQDAPPAEVNLMVNFDFDSVQLTNDGLIALQALGHALADPSLNGARFLIAGHTDAKGADGYNQTLSENRAKAVVSYLTTQFHLNPGEFDVAGYGKARPYDPNDPYAAVNRRVQVTRLSPAG